MLTLQYQNHKTALHIQLIFNPFSAAFFPCFITANGTYYEDSVLLLLLFSTVLNHLSLLTLLIILI